ncbi:LacI family DNA-binding transcriptional regulator [Salegentibacter salegens]|uniref:Transcriptional regulator, LacI family n=1 Tax=Salegentibacter salegens TaxID=143223 RepID=A0A1M7HR74_9FLAO|nr:LacI family DNA-binding transcriptional regulator [Salegentibacter salegens]PRX43171.1 LacI family transcriptional regulator [Salegentibacter salegens]SHM30920.1 transcriptional regulator, LacI family [Salegentibacter salegens]
MKKKRPSIKDIAAELKTSVTTVSFVLNGKAKEMKISEEMTQKVLDYANKINYQPNQLAQGLRTGRSNIIVFMVEDISNYFFARIARIIEDIAYKKGYKVIFCSNENNDERSRDLLRLFKERQIDGYIIIPSPGIEKDIQNLMKEKIPVVLFDRYFPGLESHYVVIDNKDAAYNATLHLIKNKFKNIAFITIDTGQNQMLERLEGYKKAIHQYDLTENILAIPYRPDTVSYVKAIIRDYIMHHDMDAIFFATNYLTQSGLEAIKENFPHFLTELGLITFDDHEIFKIYSPSISAISQPRFEIAENLMRIMISLIENSNTPQNFNKVILKSTLFSRESTKF